VIKLSSVTSTVGGDAQRRSPNRSEGELIELAGQRGTAEVFGRLADAMKPKARIARVGTRRTGFAIEVVASAVGGKGSSRQALVTVVTDNAAPSPGGSPLTPVSVYYGRLELLNADGPHADACRRLKEFQQAHPAHHYWLGDVLGVDEQSLKEFLTIIGQLRPFVE